MVTLMEELMGLVIDPAALGGLAGLIALGSWAVGRMQGGALGKRQELAPHAFTPPAVAAGFAQKVWPTSSVGDAAAPHFAAGPACQQRAYEERRALLANPVALAELHAEASAIRRDERIFECALHREAVSALPHTDPKRGCRYLGLSGQPTCPDAARHACDSSGGCHAVMAHPAPAPPQS